MGYNSVPENLFDGHKSIKTNKTFKMNELTKDEFIKQYGYKAYWLKNKVQQYRSMYFEEIYSQITKHEYNSKYDNGGIFNDDRHEKS